MKNYILILISIILLFCSCDKKAIHEYYIKNNCESTIIVNVLDYQNKFSSTEITAGVEKLIYFGTTINDIGDGTINGSTITFIKDINIKKGDTILNKNLLDYHIWRFEKTSRLYARSYLTITLEDFMKN